MSKKKQKKVNPYAKKPVKRTPWGKIAAVGILAVALVLVFVLAVLPVLKGEDAPAATPTEAPEELLTGTWNIEIEVAGYGTIKAELYADIAPITVTNFVSLARSGFYDGLTFHRIISGFMIQGGDPLGTGKGGASKKIKGEFFANGVQNSLSHTRGVISMARSSAYNSASSQFFIMHQDDTSLDGNYAAFGRVTEGMEIVDAICANTPAGYNGAVAAADQPVILSIRVIEE
ncbi:MAG: peptidylprolyl isomerase [Clostridia bacterium]|nr:peptidylprolyl isomerase [Clostridia bacterium]